MKRIFAYLLCLSLLLGCASPRLKGGHSTYQNSQGAKIELVQSDNPKAASTFVNTLEVLKEYTLPAGSIITVGAPSLTKNKTNLVADPSVVLSSNMPVKITTKETMSNSIGAAQKDTMGETVAKLGSMRPVQYVGIALLLFSIASFAYPPLRVIVGSISTSMIVGAAGLGLIVLPLIIVGHEVLILCIGGGVALGWFLLHRYGKKSGEIEVLKKWVDENKNGKVDPGEMR